MLVIGNLYAFRSTDPRELKRARDPVGPQNRRVLRQLVANTELVICAWGRCWFNAAAAEMADWIAVQQRSRCLAQNLDGSPKHPLYVAKTAKPQLLCWEDVGTRLVPD